MGSKGGNNSNPARKGGIHKNEKQRQRARLMREQMAEGHDTDYIKNSGSTSVRGRDIKKREELEKLVDERRNAGTMIDGMVDDDWRSGRFKNGSAAAVPDAELAAKAAAADEAVKAA